MDTEEIEDGIEDKKVIDKQLSLGYNNICVITDV